MLYIALLKNAEYGAQKLSTGIVGIIGTMGRWAVITTN
jgi:hypothetical protein